MTATELRQRLYSVLKEAAETGREAVFTHKGRVFRIVPEKRTSFLDRLVKHDTILTSPEELVRPSHWDWLEEPNVDDLP